MMYDAIIIGGGVSGLTAGIRLAMKKKKTIILEQHSSVGGHAGGFSRKGYFFDSGVISVGVSSIQGLLEELNLSDKADFRCYTSSYRFKDYNFTPENVRDFFENAAEYFSDEKDRILEFYDSIKEGVDLMSLVSKKPNPFCYTGIRRIRKFMEYGKELPKDGMKIMKSLKERKVAEALGEFLDKNGDAYKFFTNWGYKGLNLFYFIASWVYLIETEYYPFNGFQGFADLMKEKYLSLGGELLLSAEAEKIIMGNNKCAGVEFRKNNKTEKISGKNIITAMDLKKVFLRLAGEQFLEKEFVETLKKQEMSETFIPLYIGLNIPKETIRTRFNGYEHFYYSTYMKKTYEDPYDPDYFRNIGLGLFSSCLINPDHAPKNKSNLLVLVPAPPADWKGYWGIRNGEKTPEYKKIKNEVTEQILEVLATLIPEIKDRSLLEVCELGTPHTIERFTGNTDGSSIGFTWDRDRTFVRGDMPGKYFNRYKGIDNLFLIGHQTVFGGGIPGAMITGNEIYKKIK